jgi:hypothetical protein
MAKMTGDKFVDKHAQPIALAPQSAARSRSNLTLKKDVAGSLWAVR